jgi:hypothetical protein
MSYDLNLFLVPLGYTFDDAYDDLDEGRLPVSNLPRDTQLKQNLAILKTLLTKDPELHVFPQEVVQLLAKNNNEPDNALAHFPSSFELSTDDKITIAIYPDQASVTLPYWYGEVEARRVFAKISNYLQIIQAVSDYAICDPQLNRIIDPKGDLEAMISAYLAIRNRLY